MSGQRKARFASLDDFLAWERAQPARYEFDGFDAVAMTGGTLRHQIIRDNLVQSLRARLRGGPCRVVGEPKVLTGYGTSRYPEAAVTCVPLPLDSDVIPEPVIVFEMISRSTAGADRILKVREYGATPSIQRHVLLEQGGAAATVFTRGAAGDWAGRVQSGVDAVLALPEIDATLPLEEVYADMLDRTPDGGFAEAQEDLPG